MTQVSDTDDITKLRAEAAAIFFGHEHPGSASAFRDAMEATYQPEITRLQQELKEAKSVLAEAHDWFDTHRPQWGPGTLPTWFVDARNVLSRGGKS